VRGIADVSLRMSCKLRKGVNGGVVKRVRPLSSERAVPVLCIINEVRTTQGGECEVAATAKKVNARDRGGRPRDFSIRTNAQRRSQPSSGGEGSKRGPVDLNACAEKLIRCSLPPCTPLSVRRRGVVTKGRARCRLTGQYRFCV
jgi:hypothetical protein